jgi:glycosyltransferase involved in cell wall biosynthesis
MRRVLVVIQTPTYGGPHNQVLRLREPLRRRGWETEVLLPEEPGNGAARLAEAGLKVFTAPMCRLRRSLHPGTQLRQWRHAASGVRAVRRIVADRAPDIVQVCGLMTVQGALAARRSGRPLVWQLLSTFAPLPLRAALVPLVVRWADAVMSTGVETARQHPGMDASRAFDFFPPVDLPQWRFDGEGRAAARRALGVPDDAVLVGTVGNFNRQKAHERLVEAAARLRTSNAALRFCLLGSPTAGQTDYYERQVVARAASLGLTQDRTLQFVNPGERVASLIHALDIFVLTSRAEGVPTALLESMAAGIPAVAMDVGGVGEAVVDGSTGLLVPSGDLDGFVAAVATLAADAARRQRMSAAAAARAHASFSSESCADRHVAAFQHALDRAGGRAAFAE